MPGVTKETIDEASSRLSQVVGKFPLYFSDRLSQKFGAEIYLKREDLQVVRSFKIRGAYNKMSSLSDEERSRGVVCASAGNHAQGVAYSCKVLKIKGAIFMPEATPKQKVDKVKKHGGEYVEVVLLGETLDDALDGAWKYQSENNAVFVHPFEDEMVISGQGTIGKEIIEELPDVDYVFSCVGGGGLISGTSTYLKAVKPEVEIIGVEPFGSPGMVESLKEGKLTILDEIDKFVDGAAMKKVGEKTFEIVKQKVKDVILVKEGKVATEMIDLYQNEGIIAEPAGALSVAGLYFYKDEIKDKKVVCIISGGNNDLQRYPEIVERSLRYKGLKHYFIINFTQKPGQLKAFLTEVLGPNDDIVRFEYIKKTNAEKGPAFIGIEHGSKDDYEPLLERIKQVGFDYRVVGEDDLLYKYLV
jgi:threonine dehydratase